MMNVKRALKGEGIEDYTVEKGARVRGRFIVEQGRRGMEICLVSS